MYKETAVPKQILEKAKYILKNANFSEADGDEVKVVMKEEGIFYAYVNSKKRGSFSQAVIGGENLDFLVGASNINPDDLITRFKHGMRSMPRQKDAKRRNVCLPIVESDDGKELFAKQLTQTFVSLYGNEGDEMKNPLDNFWEKMLYNGISLLIGAEEQDTKLLLLTTIYRSPELVKTYLKH